MFNNFMKTILLFLTLLASVASAFAQAQVVVVSELTSLRVATYSQFLLVTTNTSIPVRLSQTNLYARGVTFLGMKHWRTNNTGTVYIGVNPTNDTQPFPVLTGGEVRIDAAVGARLNLYNWYVDSATSGDGLVMLLDR